jgi:sRNA-binding protein
VDFALPDERGAIFVCCVVVMSNAKRRRSHAAVAALVARFPAAFSRYGSDRRPLKVGIDLDLAGRCVDVATIRAGLRSYCRNYGYLSALKAGAPRFDLYGNVAGVVSSEEAAHAREQLAEMLAPKAAKPEPKAEKAAAASPPPTMWPKLTLKRPPRAA